MKTEKPETETPEKCEVRQAVAQLQATELLTITLSYLHVLHLLYLQLAISITIQYHFTSISFLKLIKLSYILLR